MSDPSIPQATSMGPQSWSWPPKEGEETSSDTESGEGPQNSKFQKGLNLFLWEGLKSKASIWRLHYCNKYSVCVCEHIPQPEAPSCSPHLGKSFICTSMGCPLSLMSLLPVHILPSCHTMNLPGPRSHLHIFLWFPRLPNQSWLTSRHLFPQSSSTIF